MDEGWGWAVEAVLDLAQLMHDRLLCAKKTLEQFDDYPVSLHDAILPQNRVTSSTVYYGRSAEVWVYLVVA